MSPLPLGRKALMLLFVLLLLLAPQMGSAQQGEKRRVRFETADQVEIVGDFYPGSKGKDSAPIILVPPTGKTRAMKGMEDLARVLQAEGHAVLTFDWRGHGDSTTVDKNFWNSCGVPENPNTKLIKGANPNLTSIKAANFTTTYWPMLVNDLAAAKFFIDRRNDAQDCNSKNLILIGVESGGAVAALFLAKEWDRYRVTQMNPILKNPLAWDNNPEGKQTLALMCLSLQPSIGPMGVNAQPWFTTVGRTNKVPVAFLYAEGERAAQTSQNYYRALGVKDQYTVEKGIKSKTGGLDLLKIVGTEKLITNYIRNIITDKGNADWAASNVENNAYVWVTDPQAKTWIWCKREGDKSPGLYPLKKLGFAALP